MAVDDVATRKRAVAAVASALLAAALAVAAAGRGCSTGEDSPEGAVRALIEAAGAGDRELVFELTGPRTRQHLAAVSRRATELVGGSRRYGPAEMLAVRGAAGDRAPEVELESVDGDEAVVAVVDSEGKRALLTVVRIDGVWRVELVP